MHDVFNQLAYTSHNRFPIWMGKVEERIEIVLGWGKHWPPFIRPSRIPPPRQYFTKHPTCFFRGLPSPLFEFRPRWPRFPLETAYPRETHGTDRLLMETRLEQYFPTISPMLDYIPITGKISFSILSEREIRSWSKLEKVTMRRSSARD